jgi:hypothetical protein
MDRQSTYPRSRAIVSHGFKKVISSILSIQGYSIFKMAGKSKSVMGAGQPEEIKTESGSLTEHGINLKK